MVGLTTLLAYVKHHLVEIMTPQWKMRNKGGWIPMNDGRNGCQWGVLVVVELCLKTK